MAVYARMIAVVMLGRGHILAIFCRTERIAEELDVESGTTPRFVV